MRRLRHRLPKRSRFSRRRGRRALTGPASRLERVEPREKARIGRGSAQSRQPQTADRDHDRRGTERGATRHQARAANVSRRVLGNRRMTDDTMDDARAVQIERNIDLAFQFAQELVEDPARMTELPSEATVFVAPPDDPRFNEEQLARAMRA